MRTIDKTALLFEMLLGSDMTNVNRKIEEVRYSDEYVRVSNFVPEASDTQLGHDIFEKFQAIDIYGVLSMQRILEVEKEIHELDRRIRKLPSINPYLATGNEKHYDLSHVGDIGVEISAQGMKLDEFTNHQGVNPSNRKKVIKHKLFGWYKEAKKGIADNIDNSKLMLSRIRRSKVNIKSITFENIILVISAIVLFGFAFFSKHFAGFREGTLKTGIQIFTTVSLYLSLLLTLISSLICIHFRTYPFRIASKLRKQIVQQRNLIDELDKKSYQFEKAVIKDADDPFKIKQRIQSLSILEKSSTISNQDLFDYVYCEKEFYMQHNKKLLVLHNIVFALGLIVIFAALCAVVLF